MINSYVGVMSFSQSILDHQRYAATKNNSLQATELYVDVDSLYLL